MFFLEAAIDEKILEQTYEETITLLQRAKDFILDPTNYFILVQILIKAFIIVLISRIVLFAGKKFLSRMAKKNEDSRKHKTFANVFGSAFVVIVNFFMIMGVLEAFGLPTTAILAVASVGSVALGFGAQSLVGDVITGLFSVSEDYYGVDDIIKVNGVTGVVEMVGIRSLSIRSANGDLHIIPHGQIKMVTNMSREYKRAVIDLTLPYNTEPDYILQALDEEFSLYDGGDRVLGKPKVVGVIRFSESGYDVRIQCDCKAGQNWSVERDFRIIILYFLKKENISIPYPTRDIKLTVLDDNDISIYKEHEK